MTTIAPRNDRPLHFDGSILKLTHFLIGAVSRFFQISPHLQIFGQCLTNFDDFSWFFHEFVALHPEIRLAVWLGGRRRTWCRCRPPPGADFFWGFSYPIRNCRNPGENVKIGEILGEGLHGWWHLGVFPFFPLTNLVRKVNRAPCVPKIEQSLFLHVTHQ